MKVLVTGATGFTGIHLVNRLLERGHDVVGVDAQQGLFFDAMRQRGAQLHLGSVTDSDLLIRLADGCQRIYHLAAAFRKVNLSKSVYWDVNVEGTRRVLHAAKVCGVERTLYCSTQGVHGDVRHPPGNEDSPIAPADYYQLTKWEGERVVAEFVEDGLWATTVRPTAMYGPGDPGRYLMLYRRAAKGRFVMVGDGSTLYHPLYITNLIDGMECAIESDIAQGQAYIIADETAISIRHLVQEVGKAIDKQVQFVHLPFWPVYGMAWACEGIFKCLPAEPPIFRRRVDWFRQVRSFSIEKAQRELGFKPAINLSTGLKKTADWYREQGYL